MLTLIQATKPLKAKPSETQLSLGMTNNNNNNDNNSHDNNNDNNNHNLSAVFAAAVGRKSGESDGVSESDGRRERQLDGDEAEKSADEDRVEGETGRGRRRRGRMRRGNCGILDGSLPVVVVVTAAAAAAATAAAIDSGKIGLAEKRGLSASRTQESQSFDAEDPEADAGG